MKNTADMYMSSNQPEQTQKKKIVKEESESLTAVYKRLILNENENDSEPEQESLIGKLSAVLSRHGVEAYNQREVMDLVGALQEEAYQKGQSSAI